MTDTTKKPADMITVQDAKDETGASSLPATVTAAEVNERNRQYWEQPGGEMFTNDG